MGKGFEFVFEVRVGRDEVKANAVMAGRDLFMFTRSTCFYGRFVRAC